MNDDNSSEYTIQDLVNDRIQEKREEKEMKNWIASKLGTCPTGHYLERAGYKPDSDFDQRTLRVFKAGELFEEFVVSLIEETETVEKQQRLYSEKFDCSGRPDLVLPERNMVYEIKSIHSRGFSWMEQNEEPGKFQHRMQLWFYLKMLGHEEGRLLYVSKDDLRIAEYIVDTKDKEVGKAVVNELTLLNNAWQAGLPPKPPDEKDWRAKYCRYHYQCTNQQSYYENAKT